MAWTDTVTSDTYPHYADIGNGDPYDLSDGVPDPGYIQNFSYAAIDYGSGNEKTVSRIRLYMHDSTARTNFLSVTFQGSNDSTNGSDGSWDTLETFSSGNLTFAAYPGWSAYIEFSNITPYRWYRTNGSPKSNNTVLKEWEMFEYVVFQIEGYVYENGVPVVRQLYLHNRSTGALINSTTSSGDGYYIMDSTISGAHYIVCLDNAAGVDYNDLIIGPVYPEVS